MKPGKPITLAQFEIFLLVAEKQSITAAAKKLEVTKAAVSQSIRALENELGVPLFIRSTRSMRLTQEGSLLFKQCQHLQYELDVTRDVVATLHQQPEGKLRISCNPVLSESHLLPILCQYRAKFPNVDIDVIVEERMPNVKAEQIDLVFGVNWPAPDDIVARKIAETRYVLCASPAYLQQHPPIQRLTDLAQHTYIPHSGRQRHTPIVSMKRLPTNLTLSMPFAANNVQLIKTCVLQGLGISQFHEYAIADELKQGLLVEVLSSELKEKEPLYIYYQRNRFVLPKVRQLVNLIVEYFAE